MESQYPYFCQNREGWSTAAADLGSARPPSEIDTSSFATGGVSKASVGWLCLQVIFLEVFGLNDESNSWQIPLSGAAWTWRHAVKGLHGRAGQRVALQETAEAKADPSLVSKFRSGSIFAPVGGLETVGSLRKDKLRVRILRPNPELSCCFV